MVDILKREIAFSLYAEAIILVLLSIMLLLGPPKVHAAVTVTGGTNVIKGVVESGVSGCTFACPAVQDAAVAYGGRVIDNYTITDSSGRFIFYNVDEGAYNLTVYSSGFVFYSHLVVFENNTGETYDAGAIILQPSFNTDTPFYVILGVVIVFIVIIPFFGWRERRKQRLARNGKKM